MNSRRSKLTERQQKLLETIAETFLSPVQIERTPESDIASAEFVEEFTNRLLLYHALNSDPLKKKSFEYAFATSCAEAGRQSRINANPTNPGLDVEIDGVAYSCKTEAEKSIRRSLLKISKLMEARWIRDCRTPQDFANLVQERIVAHLAQYQRIVTLRAFQDAPSTIEYHLLEIPISLLREISGLRASDFSPRTENGSSGADVTRRGQVLFHLTLDGSVEKVTINSLRVDQCRMHAKWKLPRIQNLEATE